MIMINYSLCLIDDDDDLRCGMATALEENYRVAAFSSAEAALESMRDGAPDLILLDIGLPGMDGVEALTRIKQLHSDAIVIMVTAVEDIETAVQAMKSGAYDYIIKPINIDVLELKIRKALQTIALKKELEILQKKCLGEQFPRFIGESKEIRDVMTFVKKVAQSPDTPVLILGETGTGKELIARAIHLNSPNFSGPIVAVNCAAIPKDLVESELFGYERGAFSGASAGGKAGLIEEAAGGTLFLDEIGDLCSEAQAKLLRFLEDGRYYRVGGTKPLSVRTRVVSATNKDIGAMIKAGHFREDLYYRLGVIKIEVPSLNRRDEDIIPLANCFLTEFNEKFGKSFAGITPEAQEALKNYHWQGNVRELRNVIERGALLGKGEMLTLEELGMRAEQEACDWQEGGDSFETQTKSEPIVQLKKGAGELLLQGIDLTAVMESVEKDYMSEALKVAGGNECKAARLLNLNHHTFRYRRKKLGIGSQDALKTLN
jgi:DNA-binding NtrC family response regulator